GRSCVSVSFCAGTGKRVEPARLTDRAPRRVATLRLGLPPPIIHRLSGTLPEGTGASAPAQATAASFSPSVVGLGVPSMAGVGLARCATRRAGTGSSSIGQGALRALFHFSAPRAPY